MGSASARPGLFGWRGVTLITVGLVIGTLALAPGVGLAAKFLTKSQVKKRYLGNTTVVAQSASGSEDQAQATTVLCPPGFQATGGGADAPGVPDLGASETDALIVLETKPLASGTTSTGWYVETIQGAAGPDTTLEFTAYAVCAA
jgi:hypothetical protein